MDWNAAIEKNREALKRILAALVAMAGLAFPTPTIPRRLRNAVLRLLRPAEAAVRRLVIVAARDIAVPPPGPRKPRPVAMEPILRSLGLAVVLSPNEIAARAAADRRASARAAIGRPVRLAFPLFDPPRRWRARIRTVPAHAAPRILSFDGARPVVVPLPPSPADLLDATHLGLRLQALASALDDLPGLARRFARWKASHDAAIAENRASSGLNNAHHASSRPRRFSPLKLGRPPGLPRRPFHEVHDILSVLHGLAFWALERRDTS